MQAKVQIIGGAELLVEVAEDCVVFAGRCLCHQIKKNTEAIIAGARAAGKTKVVVVGDCDDHHHEHEERMAAMMKEAGIEHVWLPKCFHLDDLPFSPTAIPRFSCAQDFDRMLTLILDAKNRQRGIESRIEDEERLLKKYPIVGKVVSIESHDHCDSGGFHTLFGEQIGGDITSKVHATALFNIGGTEGVLVTKSGEIHFMTAYGMDQDILEGRDGRSYTSGNVGSIRICVGDNAPEVSVYCEPGIWIIKKHPEVKAFDIDADARFIPMWQRVEKATS